MNTNWYHIVTGQFGYPQPADDFGYLQETYIPHAGCPTCNRGKIQNKPFRFRSEPKAKHSQFIGLNWVFDEIFVREPVKSVFEKNGITGIRFSRPVFHKSGKELETIYQLHVDTVLPPDLVADDLTTETCEYPKDKKERKHLKAIGSKLAEGPFCGAVKYNFPQTSKMRFEASCFAGQPDMVRTHEWFGSGGSANRPILLSQKVKNLIDQYQWRGAFLNEIELVEKKQLVPKGKDKDTVWSKWKRIWTKKRQ